MRQDAISDMIHGNSPSSVIISFGTKITFEEKQSEVSPVVLRLLMAVNSEG